MEAIDVNAYDDVGDAPIHIAAQNGHAGMVEKLIKAGVPVDHPTKNSRESSLHLAIRNIHPEVVKTLIAHGADVNNVNIFGNKPLDTARNVLSWTSAMEKENKVRDIVDALRNAGAKH